eukprot:TRINITY_DN34892_c0_g1_i2.p1 TRINITY_DN34892_c0_g1~~TRINITY_DN34892_c0_g1_i2.p1  ORF type:complete len:226 (+),score=39.23 TRINITY_DN34892_c0_g1_i2:156-833(+)
MLKVSVFFAAVSLWLGTGMLAVAVADIVASLPGSLPTPAEDIIADAKQPRSASSSTVATVIVAAVASAVLLLWIMVKVNSASKAICLAENAEALAKDWTWAANSATATRLLAAAEAGDVEAVEKAIDWGRTPDTSQVCCDPRILEARNPAGRTALAVAAAAGHAAVCELLLEAKADVEALDLEQRSPLSHAARFKRPEVCSLLLNHGADVEAADCVARDAGCRIL